MLIHRLKEIWQRRDLIYTFVARDLKVRYRGSVLGFLWSFLDPLINAAVLYVIFTFLFARGIENFAVFLLIGILAWNFFSTSVSWGARVIMDNGGLIKKIRLPREVFPISVVIAGLIHFFLAFLVLLLFLLFTRVPFNPAAWAVFPFFLLLLFLFNLGGALFTSAVSVYFRDFPFIVESVLKVLYFATPIFYSITMIPEKFRNIYLLNPMASAITAFRQILMEGAIPHYSLFIILASVSLFALVLGWWVFSRLERGFAEEV